MRSIIGWLLTLSMSSLALTALASDRIVVKGLFAGSAVLEVNGVTHLLKVGKSSPEGVTLLHATSKFAEINHNGKVQKLLLNNDVGANYSNNEPTSVSLKQREDGHYQTSGKVNNRWVELMVDTGATNVTLNSFAAEQMGINYKSGTPVQVTTAQGNIQAYEVTLESVALGDIQLRSVRAFVIEGRFPRVILLGNTFLNRLNMQVENSTMILQAKY